MESLEKFILCQIACSRVLYQTLYFQPKVVGGSRADEIENADVNLEEQSTTLFSLTGKRGLANDFLCWGVGLTV